MPPGSGGGLPWDARVRSVVPVQLPAHSDSRRGVSMRTAIDHRSDRSATTNLSAARGLCVGWLSTCL